MRPSLIVRRPRVLSPRSRYLFGFLSSLMLGMLLLGSPQSVAAQTCAENSTAVNNRGPALAGRLHDPRWASWTRCAGPLP